MISIQEMDAGEIGRIEFHDGESGHGQLIFLLGTAEYGGLTREEAVGLLNRHHEVLRKGHAGHWPVSTVADEIVAEDAKPGRRRRR